MRVKTKRCICKLILSVNLFIILGLTGSCELGKITMNQYVIDMLIVFLFSIIPAAKLGLFKK